MALGGYLGVHQRGGPLTMADNRKIRDFVERWTGRGYEKGEAVSFWKDLLYALLTLISLSLAKAI